MLNKVIQRFAPLTSRLLADQLKSFHTASLLSCESKKMASREKTCNLLSCVQKVDIDPKGVFKYILIKVHNKHDDKVNMVIVRGYQRCNYHSDIYDEVQARLEPLDCEPLGGGRISHDPDNKKIHIYGYSQGYGKADHEVTAKLVKDAFPGYTITISDEGY